MNPKDDKTLTMKLIPVTQMDCPTCVPILEKEIKKLNGVSDARANYITKMVKVTYDSDLVNLVDIEGAIEHAGYHVAYKKYPSAASRLKGFFQKEKTFTVKTITDQDFASKVIHSSKPVAVLFRSPTCSSCEVAKEIYAQAAAEIGEKAELYTMDVTASETWQKYDITVTPTILFFTDGQPKATILSIPKKEEIVETVLRKKSERAPLGKTTERATAGMLEKTKD